MRTPVAGAYEDGIHVTDFLAVLQKYIFLNWLNLCSLSHDFNSSLSELSFQCLILILEADRQEGCTPL